MANKIVRRMMMVKITASWYKWIDWIADRREWRAKEARAVRFATRRARDAGWRRYGRLGSRR